MDRAVLFYTEQMGLTLRTRIDSEWAEFDAGERLVIGLHPARPSDTVPAGTAGAINIELRVAEQLESVVALLRSRGVVFDGDVASYAHVRLAAFKDPDGNALTLSQPVSPSAST
jgi:predicted enzyme related to lactoylglutathione lyase